MSYEVVLVIVQEERTEMVIAKRESLREARQAAQAFCGKGWTMERRPDLHSWTDNVVVSVRKWRSK